MNDDAQQFFYIVALAFVIVGCIAGAFAYSAALVMKGPDVAMFVGLILTEALGIVTFDHLRENLKKYFRSDSDEDEQ